MVKMDEVGGVGGLSPEMKALVAGEFRSTLEQVYKKLDASGVRAEPNSKWSRQGIRKEKTKPNHVVAIASCVDFRSLRYIDADGKIVGSGSLRKDLLQFDRKGDSLIIAEGSSKAVQSCEI
jgi:hypothetical protein